MEAQKNCRNGLPTVFEWDQEFLASEFSVLSLLL